MAAERVKRHLPREQDARERAKNFKEVSLGFDAATAQAEAARCLNCKNAPCKEGCPVGVNIPEFLALLKNGDAGGAGAVIKRTNSLPAICGRVCPQEAQCEKRCVRNKTPEGAVAIGACERFVGDYLLSAASSQNSKSEIVHCPLSIVNCKARVAVIGSGPAGLSCAAELAQNGAETVVFEAFHVFGGVLAYGIPEFRLPKSLVQKEIEALKARGVSFFTNTVVGKTVLLDELLKEFDAVFIGSGAGLPVFMGILGESLNGVYSANEYLTRVNLMGAYKEGSITPVKRGKNVVVVGAGNVAMDAARTAQRLGADTVTVVYRRGREEMPARAEEIRHAEEEGIRFELLAAPVRLMGENGSVKTAECVRMELGEPDASGRRSPVPIAGGEFILETDTVIVALGTAPNPLIKESCKDLRTNRRGAIETNERMMTSIENVYAGGDAVTGAATVISAMGQGRAAARSILERLMNNE